LHDDVAAPNPLGNARSLLDKELAVHDGDSPVAAAFDHLGFLAAIAEKPHVAAERNPL
jgi:hypothetical protein